MVLNRQSVKKLVDDWLRSEGSINLVGFAMKQDEHIGEIKMCHTGL